MLLGQRHTNDQGLELTISRLLDQAAQYLNNLAKVWNVKL